MWPMHVCIVSIPLNWTKYVGNSRHFIHFTRSNSEFRFREKYVIVPRCYGSLQKHCVCVVLQFVSTDANQYESSVESINIKSDLLCPCHMSCLPVVCMFQTQAKDQSRLQCSIKGVVGCCWLLELLVATATINELWVKKLATINIY